MQRNSLTTALYLVLLFLSGVAVGAFGLRLYNLHSVHANSPRPTPEEFRRRYVEDLKSRLKLTDDQVSKLGPILDETGKQIRELREKHRPELKAIQDEQTQKIRAILDGSQQAEFSRFQEERERERQRNGHP